MSSAKTVYDAIVVGSGATGSWAVKDLTEGGLNVLLLEAGRDLDVSRDFPENPKTDSLSTIQRMMSGALGQYIQVRCGLLSGGTQHFFVNDRENPYTTPHDKRFIWIRGRQLGGRLHTWGRHAPRMSNYEFKAQTLRGEGVDWPLSYEDVAPHYARIERTLGLLGSQDDIAASPDGEYAGPAETTAVERAFMAKVEAALPHVRVGRGRYLKHNAERVPQPITMALATGRLEIRSDAIASRLLIDPATGKATGVEYVDRKTRKTHAAHGKTVVLCASAIESVRILLNSECARHPNGVGGSTGQLGHYLFDHVTYLQKGRIPDHDSEASARRDSYDFGGAGLFIPSFDDQQPRNFKGRFGVQVMIGRDSPSWLMFAHGEMQPRYENQVRIDPYVKDAWGIPAARIECSHSENEIAMVDHIRRTLADIAHAAGLEYDEASMSRGSFLYKMLQPFVFTKYDSTWPGLAIHEAGGARMGDNIENSVVNSYCQAWDAENVFVTDASCFAYPGFQSPTLTAMAMTSRACQYIVDEYSKQ